MAETSNYNFKQICVQKKIDDDLLEIYFQKIIGKIYYRMKF